MIIARRTTNFDYLRDAYENAPRTVEEIAKRVGESELKDFWFDFAFDKPAVFFRYRAGNLDVTDFVRLEK